MSENSGPAGQGKSPSKPVTPKPSPTYYDAWASARNWASPVPYATQATSKWTTSGNVSNSQIREREGYMGVYSTDRWKWHPNPDGTIDSVDGMKQNTVVGSTAILGDYGNRKNPWLTDSDTLYDIPGAVAEWVNRNNGQNAISQARARLIALGRITGEDAKITGNGVDPALLNALNGAVYDITITNYNKLAVGEDMLTLDEGLLSLAPAPATTTSGGGGPGGTYVDTTRQIFKAGDYRIAVDQAYKDITGQAADEDTLDKFVAVLQRMDDKNPQKTVRKVSQGGKVTNTTVSGGVSQAEAEDVLKQQALNEPGAEQYQKATSFMDMFNKAISAKVQL
jgi:hypothetical protein